jgi:hypothetical protein
MRLKLKRLRGYRIEMILWFSFLEERVVRLFRTHHKVCNIDNVYAYTHGSRNTVSVYQIHSPVG